MQRKKPEVDVILDILKLVGEAQPHSEFVRSLTFQYQERGGLSKKQLQGLLGKAGRVEGIPPAKLATLEAVILKKPTRYKSAAPSITTPLYVRDEVAGEKIDAVLKKFPMHKRVLFFKAKYDNNEPLSATELTELDKFFKVANK